MSKTKTKPMQKAARPIQLPVDMIEATRRLALEVLKANHAILPDRGAVVGAAGFIIIPPNPAKTRAYLQRVKQGATAEELRQAGIHCYTSREERIGHRNRQTRAARDALTTIERIENRAASGNVPELLRDVFLLGALSMAMQFMGDEECDAKLGQKQRLRAMNNGRTHEKLLDASQRRDAASEIDGLMRSGRAKTVTEACNELKRKYGVAPKTLGRYYKESKNP